MEAGRTVFSAVTVALSMSATALLPDVLSEVVRLRRRDYRIRRDRVDVITPAAIVCWVLVVGRAPTGARRLLGRPDPVHKPVKQLFGTGRANFVMRRWLPVST